eukprot:scaffold8526_cov100-Isochrysis_galbana.AAC.3
MQCEAKNANIFGSVNSKRDKTDFPPSPGHTNRSNLPSLPGGILKGGAFEIDCDGQQPWRGGKNVSPEADAVNVGQSVNVSGNTGNYSSKPSVRDQLPSGTDLNAHPRPTPACVSWASRARARRWLSATPAHGQAGGRDSPLARRGAPPSAAPRCCLFGVPASPALVTFTIGVFTALARSPSPPLSLSGARWHLWAALCRGVRHQARGQAHQPPEPAWWDLPRSVCRLPHPPRPKVQLKPSVGAGRHLRGVNAATATALATAPVAASTVATPLSTATITTAPVISASSGR